MAGDYFREALILVKAESTYGTDAAPTTAANAMIATNVVIEPVVPAESVERESPRDFMGNFEQQHHGIHSRISFDIELGPASAATTPLPVAPILLASSYDQTIGGANVTYGLVSDALSAATMWIYAGNVGYKRRGVRGNLRFVWALGRKPMLRFEGLGLLPATPVAAESLAWPASYDLTAFNKPALVSNSSITTATFAGVAKGTVPWQAFEYNCGNQVEYRNLMGVEEIIIADRKPTASLTIEPNSANMITRIEAVRTEGQAALSMVHTTGSRTLTLACGQVQSLNPRHVRINDRRGLQLDLSPLPSSGDDEMSLVSA